jgi:protein TonB
MQKKVIIIIAIFTWLSLPAHCQSILNTDSVYTSTDVPPEFPGGMKTLGKYVDGKRNHKYPKEARKNKVEGQVIVQFVINEDGSCSNFEVVKGIGFGCDEAAVEAFKKMPKWQPGLIAGKPVKVLTQMGYMYKL